MRHCQKHNGNDKGNDKRAMIKGDIAKIKTDPGVEAASHTPWKLFSRFSCLLSRVSHFDESFDSPSISVTLEVTWSKDY